MRLAGLRYWQASTAVAAGAVRVDAPITFEQAGEKARTDSGERAVSYRAYCGSYHLGHMPHFASTLLRAANISGAVIGHIRTVNGSGASLEIDAAIASPLESAPSGHTLQCSQDKSAGVYAIVNVRDMRAYIGKTANLDRRRQQHLNSLRKGTHPQTALQDDWANAPNAFAFVVIDEAPEDIKKKEAYRIFIHGTQDPAIGYNFGEGFSPGPKRERSATRRGSPSPGAVDSGGISSARSGSDLLPLPYALTLSSIVDYLEVLGFDVANKRTGSGGGVWVFSPQEEFGRVAEHLKRNGVDVRRYPNGRKRYVADHYEIDPYRRLDD
jgi:hypothetical protein